MDNNPAPGNKAGGITTVFEKSLGGVTKGGTTPMMDVFQYGEPIATRGFVFMDTPGHDPVSITGLVAVILEGTPLPVVGGQIFEEIVAAASGKRTKSELSGVGEEEFAPWIIGPVM